MGTQIIKCKSGEVFAACHEPFCYEDAEWMRDVRKYVKQGCTVEVKEQGEWKFGSCEKGNCKCDETAFAEKTEVNPNQLSLSL